MTSPEQPGEREKELAARLQAMEQQLERLTARMSEEGAGDASPAVTVNSPMPTSGTSYSQPEDLADVSEEVLNWASRNALLPRVAALCFLLVIALILRTVTDSGIINKLIGSGLGMGYAATLIIAGWFLYERKSPLAPVCAACGALLMSSVVVETHSHFKALPLVPAYLTLVVTGIAMALISRKYGAFTPISVGTLGMCLAGAAIDYPHPYFPYLSLVLFAATILANIAAQMKHCGWLRWTAAFVSMFMLQLWGYRLGYLVRKGETIPPDAAPALFLPILAVFALTYFALALYGIISRTSERVSRFDAMLPTINSLWAFSTALYMVGPTGSASIIIGVIGSATALGFLAISFWYANRTTSGTGGAGALVFASGALLAVALPTLTGKIIFSLPILSVIAIFMAVISRSWKSGSVRLATYLFSLYCGVVTVFLLRGDSPMALDFVAIVPAGLVACIVLYHFQWCRLHTPDGYTFFDRFDPKDRTATLLLLTGLLCCFSVIRSVIHQTLLVVSGAVVPAVFSCSQSVLINGAGLVLIVLAFVRRNKELRNMAILITLAGGFKVFASDLLGIHGMPLVFSVFSFGLLVAVESIALGKWPKADSDGDEVETPPN